MQNATVSQRFAQRIDINKTPLNKYSRI